MLKSKPAERMRAEELLKICKNKYFYIIPDNLTSKTSIITRIKPIAV